ncbi:hypothetical protein EC973_008992 [Apophysomyces ossiformis]|uniref:Uncharacterized protein n=1 Tax=Apophysomyces ossiformis TaxID=679940 RepID=A0A8H7EPF4_9FUNG|nr:hypothetical protein EC973_008992 [Apophysomyces ossiformis]
MACWLIKAFGCRFAIYYAILTIPSSCDDQFIRVLLNNGALVPRYLVQTLVTVYGKPAGRRRSNDDIFSLGFLDNMFSEAVQQLPFTGFATLVHIGYERYGNVLTTRSHGDLGMFLDRYMPTNGKAMESDTNAQTLIEQYAFIPAPLVPSPNVPPPTSLRVLLRLATTESKLFRTIQPVFEFDPVARRYLWEVVLLFLFDLSFRANIDRAEDHDCLKSLRTVIRPANDLIKSIKDQDLFCFALVSLLRKYPTGYCDKKMMSRMLHLLVEYVEPGFSLMEVLEELTRREIRTDTKESIQYFLTV